jgi:glycosyltransferase involved in cell wall biosynthesis
MLAPAIVEARVIPNGVDRTIFCPGDRRAARAQLGIADEALVLLFVASDVRRNPFKDFRTLHAAVSRIAAGLPDRPVLFVALGQIESSRQPEGTEVRYVPFESDPHRVARYYRAADLYLHAARADTFPLSVLEALASGTPVVATAVGGIPEQVRSLRPSDAAPAGASPGVATGALTRPGDVDDLARAAVDLLNRPDLVARLGVNAARDAERRFDLDDQCDAYLQWYDRLVAGRRGPDAMSDAG